MRSLAGVNDVTVASGSVDTSIRLWDVRAPRDAAGVLQGQCDAVIQV